MSATIVSTNSIRFEKGDKPEIVKHGDLEYITGRLSKVGQKSMSGVIASIRRYLKNEWGYTLEDESEGKVSLDATGVANILLSDESIVVLLCDYSQSLTPADLLEYDDEFVTKCYSMALELNPKLKNRMQVDQPTGQAQPETHDDQGNPKTPEETPKN